MRCRSDFVRVRAALANRSNRSRTVPQQLCNPFGFQEPARLTRVGTEETFMRCARFAAAVALLSLAVASAGRPVDACCMVPLSWHGDVDQADQNVVVLHHAGHEELVLRVSPFFQTVDKQPLPEVADATPPYVEWVVTVPSAPTAYHTVPASIYKDADALASRLEDLAAKQYAARSRWEWPEFRAMLGREAP